MFDKLQYQILKRTSPWEGGSRNGTASARRSKLLMLFGPELDERVRGKTVIDFGCGEGHEAIELAKLGAKEVTGIDIRQRILDVASANASRAGMRNCKFTTSATERADIIVSIDGFEHFEQPAHVLATMDRLLNPDGEILISFGPPWYHPFGGHLFSGFPWAHLIFSERALIRWRSDFKMDGATRFQEVDGGLNQMTIRRFERLVAESPLHIAEFETVPIAAVSRLHCRLTREFFTSIVRCTLVHRRTRRARINTNPV